MIEKADGTVHGNGVNVAARLQALADPGATWVSDSVRGALGTRHVQLLVDQGRHDVKNIAEPVHAFSFAAAGTAARRRGRRRLFAGVGATLLLALLSWAGVHLWRAAAGPVPLPMSLMVAPFISSDGDARGSALADALRRDLVAVIAGPWHNFVTVLPARGMGSDPWSDIARRAGARYLLEGHLRSEAGGHELTLQLVESDSGAQAGSFALALSEGAGARERTLALRQRAGDVFGLLWQKETLRTLKLPVEQLRPVELLLRAWAAYDAYPGVDGIAAAQKLFDRALALDPHFVPVLTQSALMLANRYDEETNPDHEAVVRRLDELTSRAIALDAREVTAWRMRTVALVYLGRWTAASEAAERAIALDPDSAELQLDKSWVLLMTGRTAEALPLMDAVITASPTGRQGWPYRMKCAALVVAGEHRAATDTCERSLGQDPTLWSNHLYLAAVHAELGDLGKARAALDAVRRMSPGYTIARLKAYRYAQHPEYVRLVETNWYPGLRRAGMPER